MSSTLVGSNYQAMQEPIAGYVLREKVGSGGYGEVWKADAPGGLTKAVKIVYGTVDDRCASRELKSLNRIKALRHPFLLSIERIEIVGNRLLIVTEFAESCLKRRFLARRTEGLPGIPRDELLKYLAEAAEALDFIRDQHRLQHLDVKPENLLLNCGHVKVGDFGLLKNLEETQVSLVSGLTPLYAPPELFDGRPDLQSDQYSLAIVYQEMLTGEAPFSGRTTAQLAAQHLKSPPVLAPLPPADQPIIGRALSKNPERRYGSCTEMIAALVHARQDSRSWPPLGNLNSDRTTSRVASGQSDTVDSSERGYHGKLFHLPTLPTTELSDTNRPLIVVGLGGLGIGALQQLKARLSLYWGNVAELPTVQLLAIDTDLKALMQACSGDGPSSLRDQETLAVPLRTASQYRAGSEQILQWMSRRWLFNIPRSLKTHAIRPLGRLAFADHLSAIRDRCRVAISSAISPHSRQLAERSHIPFESTKAPRLFLVGSTSGGTASGMLADMAYLLRMEFESMGLETTHFSGILMHASNRNSQNRDIALANSYVCLKEIEHFSTVGNHYPGDPALGIPLVEHDAFTFPHLYFANLGDELSSEGFTQSLEAVAEYLFCASAGRSAHLLDIARQSEIQQIGVGLSRREVRSFGVRRVGAGKNSQLQALGHQCELALWTQLLGPSAVSKSPAGRSLRSEVDKQSSAAANSLIEQRWPDLKPRVDALTQQLRIDGDSLLQFSADHVCKHFELKPGEYFRQLATELVAECVAKVRELHDPARWEDVIAEIEFAAGVVNSPITTRSDSPNLSRTLNDAFLEPIQANCERLKNELTAVLDDRQFDPLDVQIMGEALVACCLSVREQLEHNSRAAGAKADELRQQLMSGQLLHEAQHLPGPPEAAYRELAVQCLLSYADYRLTQTQIRAIAAGLRRMEDTTTDLLERLRLSLVQLQHRAQRHYTDPSPPANNSADHAALQAAVTELWQAVRSFARRNEVYLSRVLLSHGRDLEWFGKEVEQIAQRLAFGTAPDSDSSPSPPNSNPEPLDQEQMRGQLADAFPSISECGGGVRFMILGRDSESRQRLTEFAENELKGACANVSSPHSEILICCEMEQIPIRNATRHLLKQRQDLVEIAGRLRSRIDVDWDFLK